MYKIINWNNAAKKCNNGEEIDFLNLPGTPHEENCTQAGQDIDSQIKECTALINQLIREQGAAPAGTEFFIIENTGHDFGIYYEVGIFYQPLTNEQAEANEDSISEDYATNIESNLPEKWDKEALKELREAAHPAHQPAKVIIMKAA